VEYQQAELMANRKVSGLLIVPTTCNGDMRLRDLQATGLAVVAFDRPLPGTDTDCVLVDNRSGAEEATQHLIEHGHRRIVCVGYDEHSYTIHERVTGFTHRMNLAGLMPHTAFGLNTREEVHAWLGKLMATPNRPTAIFSLNHRTSMFMLQALSERRIRIPDEMALVGFDDFDLATVLSPPLTTVAQSPAELARRAMDLLLMRIQTLPGPAQSVPAKILLPVKLMVRASGGPHATN